MTKSIFMKTLRENEGPKPQARHPLELQSRESSLTKLQRAGFGMPAGAVIAEHTPRSPSGTQKTVTAAGSPLAKYLRKEYGEMIPKTNLRSLPDFKITEFIRILSEYHKKMESNHSYLEAKRARGKVRELAQIELLHQISALDDKHKSELKELQTQQNQDFVHF